MIKVIELFSGVGSQRMALRNLGIKHEVVGIAEIDKYALQSYEAIHGDCPNLGDISKVKPEDVPEHDLLTYSFPCQDISVAGKMNGLSKGSGTRSGLLWECAKIIKHHKPKYLLLENVKNLVGQKFKPDFDEWLQWLDQQGYVNYWQVLNAKDYGIPQNRERVFVVSIRKDVNAKRTPYAMGFLNNDTYKFPGPIELKLKLKDMLENEVDEKYYLSERIIKGFIKHKKRHEERGNGFKFEPIKDTDTVAKAICTSPGTRTTDNYIDESKFEKGGVCGKDYTTNREQAQRLWNENGYSPCITTANTETLKIVTNTKKGYEKMEQGDSLNLDFPESKTRRGRVGKEVAQTLTTSCNQATLDKYRIRKLTPLECWRLMGFTDEDFKKAKDSGLSDTQLYKQAGNSIVVNVLEGIFKNLLK